MQERRQILKLWQERLQQNDASHAQPAVLVTLTCATGSSYRRPGAHVLLLADGRHAGTISGGCLEAEVARKAFWMTRHGAVMQRYSTLFDDTAEIPFGLGCGGEIDILLEPADTPECEALIEAMRASLHGEERTAITILPAGDQPLQRMILTVNEEQIFASPGTLSATAERFVESLNPPQRLIVFGAGDDAQPLVDMAAKLGWSVLVADGRRQLAQSERFSAAERVVSLDEALSIAPLQITGKDAVVLMTHSYAQDRALLAQLLPLMPLYLGVLGARHRSSLLVNEVAALLGWSIPECAALLHAPTGLDLGGDAPESVALSILAEAHTRTHNRTGQPRRISAGEMLEHLHNASRGIAPAVCALDAASLPVKPAAPKGK